MADADNTVRELAAEVHALRLRLKELDNLVSFSRRETTERASSLRSNEAERIAKLEKDITGIRDLWLADIKANNKQLVQEFTASDQNVARNIIELVAEENTKGLMEVEEKTLKSARSAAADAESMRIVTTQQATTSAEMLRAVAHHFAQGE